MSTEEFFKEWCECTGTNHTIHKKDILKAKKDKNDYAIKNIAQLAKNHYVNPEHMAERLKELGFEKTGKILQTSLPTSKKTRSGDLGEILGTEYIRQELQFDVPINRLRWKDHRELPLRGDDIIGIKMSKTKKPELLKAECKSAKTFSKSILKQAAEKLIENNGLPSGHSLTFIASRLREEKRNSEALVFEKISLDGLSAASKRMHLFFVFSQNDSEKIIDEYLQETKSKIPQNLVGVVITEHQEFIRTVFENIKV